MNKISSILIIVALCIGLYTWMSFNEINNANNDVVESWQQLQIMFYRRNALIPLLANIAKEHGMSDPTLMEVVHKTNTAALKISMIPAYKNTELMNEFRIAQNSLSFVLTQLIFAANGHPTLTADPKYVELLNKFAITAKSIVFARTAYNKSTAHYNKVISRFPTNIVAKLFGYEPRAYFTIYQRSPEELKSFQTYILNKTNDENTLLNGI